MQKLNFLQLIKEQKQKEDRRHKAQLAQLVGQSDVCNITNCRRICGCTCFIVALYSIFI